LLLTTDGNFDTSFSGKDLLRTTLRAGNAGGSAFASSLPVSASLDARNQTSVTPGAALEAFPQAPTVLCRGTGPNVGPVAQGYTTDGILNLFGDAGSPLTDNLALAVGAGM